MPLKITICALVHTQDIMLYVSVDDFAGERPCVVKTHGTIKRKQKLFVYRVNWGNFVPANENSFDDVKFIDNCTAIKVNSCWHCREAFKLPTPPSLAEISQTFRSKKLRVRD